MTADGHDSPSEIARLRSRTATSTPASNVFWVPAEARWECYPGRAQSSRRSVESIDNAMDLIEKREPETPWCPAAQLRPGGPRQGPARPARRPHRLDRLHRDRRPRRPTTCSAASTNTSSASSPGRRPARTPAPSTPRRSVVKTLVEMLEPYHGRVYDPACGSGGMFVQSAEFVTAHGGKRNDISVYGQEFTDDDLEAREDEPRPARHRRRPRRQVR